MRRIGTGWVFAGLAVAVLTVGCGQEEEDNGLPSAGRGSSPTRNELPSRSYRLKPGSLCAALCPFCGLRIEGRSTVAGVT